MRFFPIVLLVAACGTIVAIEGEVPDSHTPAQIAVESTGGIATLRVRLRLDSLSGIVSRETCSLSVPATECGSRGNRESAAIAKAEVTRIFALTAAAEFRALRADYGHSTQGADLMEHRVSVTANARTRAITADDITRPEPLAGLMSELSRSVK